MPDRQKRLFVSEIEEIKAMLVDYQVGSAIYTIGMRLSNLENSSSTILRIHDAENQPEVVALREAQKDQYEINRLEAEQRERERKVQASTGEGLGYVISDSPPMLGQMSLLGGAEYNKRQLLVIDPSTEMRD